MPLRIAALLLVVGQAAAGQSYTLDTLAGGVPPPTPAGALQTTIGIPQAIAFDSAGNLYLTSSLQCVFKIDRTGLITLIAGNARAGYSGDGGPATQAQLNNPLAVALDSNNDVYIADTNNDAIRVISTDGIIHTLNGHFQLKRPMGVAVSRVGDVYVADTGNNRILKIGADGSITTATDAAAPVRLVIDSGGTLFYVEHDGNRIRKIDPAGLVSTVAQASAPGAIAVGPAGDLYFIDLGDRILSPVLGLFGLGTVLRRIAVDGTVSTVIKNSDAGLSGFVDVAVDASGSVYLAATSKQVGRVDGIKFRAVAGTLLPEFPGDGGEATAANLDSPTVVAADRAGNVYIAESGSKRVRKVLANGLITTVVDSVSTGLFKGNAYPNAIAVGPEGQLFFGSRTALKIWTLESDGTIRLIKEVLAPLGLSTDSYGELFVLEYFGALEYIWRLSFDGTRTGIFGATVTSSIAAASDGSVYFLQNLGDVFRVTAEGRAALLTTGRPFSGSGAVAIDSNGLLYVSDSVKCTVSQVGPTGTIVRIAGTGVCAYSGDGGPALNGNIRPGSLSVDLDGNVYVAEPDNNAVRVLRRVSTSTPESLSLLSGKADRVLR